MFDEGRKWLDGLSSRGIRPGLDNIRALLEALGNPQDGGRFIHVAGSDGKGSVCCMLESILVAAGYRVGMFTSPHIMSVTECIRVDGKEVSEAFLERYLYRVRWAADACGCECTGFEALTACAFLVFADEGTDIGIIEAGMGGRLDSTNVIVPDVAVINSIGLEHTRFLGPDIGSIAGEKAGIMKPGVPCITINSGKALEVIAERADRTGCPLVVVDPEDIDVAELAPDHTMIRYGCGMYRLGLPGSYQGRNAALAIETVLAMRDAPSIRHFIPVGLDTARWPARMEKLDGLPLILDVTHTVSGAVFLRDDIERIYGRVVLVTAMLSDKDLDGVARLMSQVSSKVLVSSPDSPRAAPAEELAAHYRRYHDDVTVYGTVGEAVDQALHTGGTVLVTGSFRTAEDCLRWLARRR